MPPPPRSLITTISVFLLNCSRRSLFPLSFSLLPLPPRFITMSLNLNLNPKIPNFNNRFPNPQSLHNWLQPRLPSDSFSTRGTSTGTKNIHNLWLELADGEIELIDSTPPVRNLEVVCVRVRNNDNTKLLIEAEQEMLDGTIRTRGRRLSEKMKAGEDVESAAKRAIKEELGDYNFVRVLMDKYERKVDERESVSYPGLPACYVLHYVDAVVDGLPEGEFVTEEGEEYCGGGFEVANEAVKVKRHFWKWVDDHSL